MPAAGTSAATRVGHGGPGPIRYGPHVPEPGSTNIPAGWATRHFPVVLAGIVAAGAVLRVVYVLTVGSRVELGLDAAWYVVQGQALADGHGYIDPRVYLLSGDAVPTANFPPLWPLVLAVADRIGLASQTANQLVGAGLGTLTVPVTALLGRRVAGAPVGLIAAGIVAGSPALIAADGSLMSESLYVLVVTAVVWVATTAADRPTPGRFALVGFLCGLALITRSDALFLIPLLVVVLVWGAAGVSGWGRVGRVAVLVAALAVPYGTWVTYSSVRLHAPVFTTSNAGNVFTGANCDSTYHGALLGAWDSDCAVHLEPGGDEVAFAARGRDEGLAYARSHLTRTPLVATARVLRTFGLWDPGQTAALESVETRSVRWQQFAWGVDLVVFGAAAFGMVLLARRRQPIAPILAVVAGVVVAAAVSNGNQRFRLAADPSLAVAAAVAVLWGVGVLTRTVRARPGPFSRRPGNRP